MFRRKPQLPTSKKAKTFYCILGLGCRRVRYCGTSIGLASINLIPGTIHAKGRTPEEAEAAARALAQEFQFKPQAHDKASRALSRFIGCA